MADVTGGTPPTNASSFDVPADIKAVYDHFGDPAMYRATTAGSLAPAASFAGRTAYIQDSGRMVVSDGANWKTYGGVLPDKVEATTTTISGTTPNSSWVTNAWAGVTLDLPAQCLVRLELQCWVAVTGSTNDYRADVVVSGATTIAAQSAGWGAVAYGSAGTTKSVAAKTVVLNAGTNTIKVASYRVVNTTGTFDLSQATLTAIPLRYV